MNNHENIYYPLQNFMPPVKEEKISLRECKISKIQWELEKYISRSKAASLTKILEENGFTYFQKLLDAEFSVFSMIKGIGPVSLDAIRSVRKAYGVKEN